MISGELNPKILQALDLARLSRLAGESATIDVGRAQDFQRSRKYERRPAGRRWMDFSSSIVGWMMETVKRKVQGVVGRFPKWE